jgi:hypothetical protein
MKSLTIILAIILSAFMLYAQTDPEWVWAHGGGGVNVDSGRGVSTDGNGNIYLTGWFNGEATFGDQIVTSMENSNDVLVMKLDSNADIMWIATGGGSYMDNAYAIATQSNGTSLVTGEFSGSATFGTATITSDGAGASFVACINTDGQWLWAVSVTGSGYGEERAYGVAVDSNGDGYVTGYIKGNAVFGSIILNTNSGDDPAAFVAKISTGGNWLWAVKAGGTSWENGTQSNSVAVNGLGNVYVTGYFTGTVDAGTGAVTSAGSGDIFIGCLDFNGGWQWFNRAGGTAMDAGGSIAADGLGNCYVTGYFESTAGFGGTSLTSVSGTDIFVAKLNSSGIWQWAKRGGGSGSDQARGIAADMDGNCYFAGYINGAADFGSFNLSPVNGSTDIVAVKLDEDSNWEWAETAGGNAEDYAMAICCDNQGNCYVTGIYSTSAMFGNNSITGNYMDIFIAKHSSANVGNDDQTEIQSPAISILHNAYPNPFRAGQSVSLAADIAKSETGTLSVYNLKGQLIESHDLTSGSHEISLDSHNLASGIYFYSLNTPSTQVTKKLVLLK